MVGASGLDQMKPLVVGLAVDNYHIFLEHSAALDETVQGILAVYGEPRNTVAVHAGILCPDMQVGRVMGEFVLVFLIVI